MLLGSACAAALALAAEPALAFLASSIAAAPGLVTVTTFVVQNFSGSNSPGYIRLGLPFKKGDIPRGSAPQIQIGAAVISAQFDQRRTWSDGSLAFAVCHLRDTTFSGSESRTYTVTVKPGSYVNTGTKALGDITGAHAWKVTFANATQYNGSTNVARGSGAFTADFNKHAAVATRVTKVHSGPVCESWVVWGMATDDSSRAADPHLKTNWYVSIWKDANDNIADFEYVAVVEQDWWDVANKFRLNYDATLKDGSSTINAYSAVQHPYHAHWATVRTEADDNQGRRFWVKAIPTLIYKPSKSYWVTTGYVPPLDTTFSPTSNTGQGYTAGYVPCSAENHRASINDTGGYMGRGMIPNADCVSFMRQTSNDYKCSRVNAFAGLHVPYHYRSAQSRTRRGEGADVANTTIALKFRPNPASAYDFTAKGMPAAIDAYVGPSESFPSTYAAKTGGTGVWTVSQEATHAVAYSYFMYLLEGEWHFMQASIELATNCVHQQQGNTYAGCSKFLLADTAPWQAMFSIPSTQYSGLGSMNNAQNARMTGWALMLFGQAVGIVPDDDVQSAFIKYLAAAQTQFVVDNFPYLPPELMALGVWNNPLSQRMCEAPWMQNINMQGAWMNWRLTESANTLSFIKSILANQSINQWADGLPYQSEVYHEALVANPDTTFKGPWLSPKTYLAMAPAVIAGNVVTINSSNSIERPVDGQPFYFLATNNSFGGSNIPAGFSAGTIYYMVSSSGLTFKVALTPGGAPQTIPDTTNVTIGAHWSSQSTTPAANPPGIPAADDYSSISRCALIGAHLAGAPGATFGLVNSAQSFLAPTDSGGYGHADWVTWRWALP